MKELRAQRAGEQRRALYSDCGAYRYLLEVAWLPARGMAQFIGLNPSTATETMDDPTLRRCKQFAADWGYGGLLMTNVAAFRATDPREMAKAGNPVGTENTAAFLSSFDAPLVVACWGGGGAHKRLAAQAAAVRVAFGGRLQCFGLTDSGQPLHPLYLPRSAKPGAWEAAQ